MIENNLEIGEVLSDNSTPFDNNAIEGLPLVFPAELNYREFFETSMLVNIPCTIKSICVDWEASKQWVINNKINYEYFINEYGELTAPVADCEKINFNSQCKNEMKIKSYIEYLKCTNKEKILYLKDWHLKAVLKSLNKNSTFYEVPKIFASDWLNEYAEDKNEDDFQFVYIGSTDTWTPLHADVYSSFSWSVNIVGKKKWIILPPGEEKKLKDPLGNLPILFDPLKCDDTVKYLEVIQEKGEGIFVPSGWHHQVFNLCDTISINHNFINSCNLKTVWEALQNSLIDVETEIKEFESTPEYTNQCQVILKSLFGMDICSFINFIIHIAEKRIKQMTQGETFYVFNNFTFGKNHIMFDLKSILKVICLIENHPIIVKNCLSQNVILQFFNTKKKILDLIKMS